MNEKELKKLLDELLKKDESDSYIEFKADLEPCLIGEYSSIRNLNHSIGIESGHTHGRATRSYCAQLPCRFAGQHIEIRL